MPNPTSSELHFNQPLTNVSVGYMADQKTYIADKVFPKVPVEKRGDVYYKYSKSDWRRTDAQKRAPATQSAGSAWRHTTDNYYCDVFAVHKDIDDQDRANADTVWRLDKSATKFVTNQLALKRDIDWTNEYFKPGVWATNLTGNTGATGGSPTATNFKQWDQTTSSPLGDVSAFQINFLELTGYAVNFMVLGARVWKALKNHPEILDRIKFTQRGQISKELVAEFFEVDNLYIATATQATGPVINDAKAQDAAATFAFITNSKGVLLGYANPEPGLEVPSAGYTFSWTAYGNGEATRVKKFRMEEIESDRVEASFTYDQKVVANDCGIFLDQAVA